MLCAMNERCVPAFYKSYFLIFFFQAGDGIRDDLVTGVQTCALPILAQVLVGEGLEGAAWTPAAPSSPSPTRTCATGTPTSSRTDPRHPESTIRLFAGDLVGEN